MTDGRVTIRYTGPAGAILGAWGRPFPDEALDPGAVVEVDEAYGSVLIDAGMAERTTEQVRRVEVVEPVPVAFRADVLPTPDTDSSELKGAALDDALRAAGLSTSGTADERRARLSAYLHPTAAPEQENP